MFELPLDSQHEPDYTTNLRVGTSGYSFEDWRGVFYSPTLDKGKMLDYYVRRFPTVEINSTYYRIPHPRVFGNMVQKAPPGFDFMVKVPRSFTHRRTELENDVAAYREAIRPMEEAGLLSGVLAQFPYSFKYSPRALDYVAACRDLVAPNQLYAEFRHDSWVNRTMYVRLKAEGIGYVSVDEPQLPGLLKPNCFATTDIGYIRLHGRNAEQWWDGGPLRYDYKYSEQELSEWKEKVRKLLAKSSRVYIFFNNCHQGQAVDNAFSFMASLES